jgi:alpha-amylase
MRRHAPALLLLAVACRHDPSPTPAAPASPPAEAAAAPANEWWRDAVFYEIFIRSFADSDGDGVGDFEGLTARLDHLNDGDPNTDADLGITGIWLMPIHPSPSYHGYDVTDYQAVNPAYGTMEDFERLLAEAHKRGIKVIIDFVLNHSARAHPWFEDAAAGPKAAHRSFYTFRDAPDPRWKRPWDGASVWHETGKGDYFYGLFWSGMPDLNLANPAVEQAMGDAMAFWLDKGVDGFRVDAVRHLFESPDGVLVDQAETHAFMKRLRTRLAPAHPDALFVAEAWTDSETVAKYRGEGGEEFQLAFSFDAASALVAAARDGLKVSVGQYDATAARVYGDRGFEAPFLTNHDMPRVMRLLQGDLPAAKLAAATLMALPGTPFIYYGEELGMQGGGEPRDEDKRTPMRWVPEPGHGFTTGRPWHDAAEAPGVSVAEQLGQDSLRSTYRAAIRARRAHPALTRGDVHLPALEGGGRGGLAILRTHQGQRALFVANLHREAAPGPLKVAVAGQPRVLWAQGLVGAPKSEGGQVVLEGLGAQAFAFLALE